jgi:hypothetical protein
MNQCDCAENCQKEMPCAGLLIYDLEKDKYYRTNQLPVNINQPAVTITQHNKITILGGEANPTFLKNGRFVMMRTIQIMDGDRIVQFAMKANYASRI